MVVLLLIVAVILWVLCGIPAGLIAHAKGRNVPLWTLLGSVFGLFGLATIASVPHVAESSPWDAGSGDTINFGGYGSFGGWGSSSDWGGSGSDFGFGDFGSSGGDSGGGCGGGGCGGGGGD